MDPLCSSPCSLKKQQQQQKNQGSFPHWGLCFPPNLSTASYNNLSPQYERHDTLQRVQSVIKMMKELEHLSWGERLRDLQLFSSEKKRISMCTNTNRERWSQIVLSSAESGQEATATNWSSRCFLWPPGNTAILCRRWSTSTSCPDRLLISLLEDI